MFQQLEIVQYSNPENRLEEINEIISSNTVPVRRGTHIGNQEPHDLYIELELPKGVDVIASDTINGNDRDSQPRYIVLPERKIPLFAAKEKNKIVGSLAIRDDIDEIIGDRYLAQRPQPGENILEFHSRVLDYIDPNNKQVLMSEFFAGYSDLYRATMQSDFAINRQVRKVDGEGKITICDSKFPEKLGIFGMEDASSKFHGALPSLNVMIAMDVLISNALGHEQTIHLGGEGMAKYMNDNQRLKEITRIITRACAELDYCVEPYTSHTYNYIDATFMGNLLKDQAVSQHHMALVQSEPFEVVGASLYPNKDNSHALHIQEDVLVSKTPNLDYYQQSTDVEV